jgi:hypothetical protein
MHAQNIVQEVAEFNQNLEKAARDIVQARKAQHLKQSNLLSQLGVPLKRVDNVPATFTVPAVKKKVIVKPSAPNIPFTPEPTLDESVYEAILMMCHDLGVEMERHPGIYENKNEETLRDHFILVLAPQFESVTGETFNKAGKTDILIRHEKSNVFVAECKFWRDIKAFHDAIDQVLNYLTWRDSKAAILCFVKSKELTPVLSQIESDTADHPQFVKYHGSPCEGRFNFEFHLPEDRSRAVRLAVYAFIFQLLSKNSDIAR